MSSSSLILSMGFFALLIIAIAFGASEAAYRKPPFNGSIFGKRANTDYENARSITALCEIAIEACQSWFPAADSK